MKRRDKEKNKEYGLIGRFVNSNFGHTVEFFLILYGVYICLYPILREESTTYILLVIAGFPVSIPYFALKGAWNGSWLPIALIFVLPVAMAAVRSSLKDRTSGFS